jgi:predicted Zn-dependent protease
MITGFDGKPITQASSESGEWQKKLKDVEETGHSFPVEVSREGKPMTLLVTGQPECDFPVTLNNSDALNAYADGHKVVITRGMLRFAKNDDELALVISHEIAHDAMGHIQKKEGNRLIGTFVDVLIAAVAHVNTQGAFGRAGSQAFSQEFESEADYVGLYIMARAGMPIDDAPNFWRRMAAAHPGSIRDSFSSTHPSSPERMLALEKTVQEIHNKEEAGSPLLPDMKKSDSSS